MVEDLGGVAGGGGAPAPRDPLEVTPDRLCEAADLVLAIWQGQEVAGLLSGYTNGELDQATRFLRRLGYGRTQDSALRAQD